MKHADDADSMDLRRLGCGDIKSRRDGTSVIRRLSSKYSSLPTYHPSYLYAGKNKGRNSSKCCIFAEDRGGVVKAIISGKFKLYRPVRIAATLRDSMKIGNVFTTTNATQTIVNKPSPANHRHSRDARPCVSTTTIATTMADNCDNGGGFSQILYRLRHFQFSIRRVACASFSIFNLKFSIRPILGQQSINKQINK
jgi:hypothetical protein